MAVDTRVSVMLVDEERIIRDLLGDLVPILITRRL